MRAFARACGYEAETDPRDAQVLSRVGSAFQENCTRRPEPKLEELPDLLHRRRQLAEQKGQAATPAVAESTNRDIAWLEEEITKPDQQCQELPQNSAALTQRAARYRTAPGVGISTPAILVAHLPELGLPELGLLYPRAPASLVGAAPWSRDSGTKRGQRPIRGGRRVVRRAWYICTWSVIRVDGEMRSCYQGPRQRGKPGKVALVTVMRKLWLQLNAAARRGTPWVFSGNCFHRRGPGPPLPVDREDGGPDSYPGSNPVSSAGRPENSPAADILSGRRPRIPFQPCWSSAAGNRSQEGSTKSSMDTLPPPTSIRTPNAWNMANAAS